MIQSPWWRECQGDVTYNVLIQCSLFLVFGVDVFLNVYFVSWGLISLLFLFFCWCCFTSFFLFFLHHSCILSIHHSGILSIRCHFIQFACFLCVFLFLTLSIPNDNSYLFLIDIFFFFLICISVLFLDPSFEEESTGRCSCFLRLSIFLVRVWPVSELHFLKNSIKKTVQRRWLRYHYYYYQYQCILSLFLLLLLSSLSMTNL